MMEKIEEEARKRAIRIYTFYTFRKGILKRGYECILVFPSDTLPNYWGRTTEQTVAALTREPAYVLHKWQIRKICEEYSKLENKEDISKLVEIVESVATFALPVGLLVPVVTVELPEEEVKGLFEELRKSGEAGTPQGEGERRPPPIHAPPSPTTKAGGAPPVEKEG